jgi:N-acyl-L-homoserine lactone synthetase
MLEVAPVRVDVATSAEEIEAIYRLRYEVAVEEGWARSAEMPGGLERDSYDDDALHIAAWSNDELAAVQRLVFPAEGRLLPTEEAFDLTVEPKGSVLDVGRTTVAPAHRGDSTHLLLMTLQSRSWLEWRSRGFHTCLAVQTEPILRMYREMGVVFEVLAPAREYWNERRFPIRLDVAASADRLMGIWSDRIRQAAKNRKTTA